MNIGWNHRTSLLVMDSERFLCWTIVEAMGVTATIIMIIIITIMGMIMGSHMCTKKDH